jgi:hypothetical protein
LLVLSCWPWWAYWPRGDVGEGGGCCPEQRTAAAASLRVVGILSSLAVAAPRPHRVRGMQQPVCPPLSARAA